MRALALAVFLSAPALLRAQEATPVLEEFVARGWHREDTLREESVAPARALLDALGAAQAKDAEEEIDRRLAVHRLRGLIEGYETLERASTTVDAWLPTRAEFEAAVAAAREDLAAADPFLARLEARADAARKALDTPALRRDDARASAEIVTERMALLEDRWRLERPDALPPAPRTRALLRFLQERRRQAPARSGEEKRARTWNAFVHQYRWNVGIDLGPGEILALGRDRFRETERELEAVARRIDPSKGWRELAEGLKDDHPDAEGLLEACRLEMERARAFVEKGGFVSVPEWATHVTAEWGKAGANTPYGYYDALDADDPQLRGRYVVTPVTGLSGEAQTEVLRGNNRPWIRVVSLHEAIPGHHLQFAVAARRTRAVRKGHYNPAYVEGWGLYCEELMHRHGYYDDRTRLTQLRMRLWRCARIVIDVGCQFGGMSKDEAIRLLTDAVGIEGPSAAMEVARYLNHPGYYSGYIVGLSRIEALRDRVRERLGDRFDERAFHDRLLELGPLPFSVIEEAMTPR